MHSIIYSFIQIPRSPELINLKSPNDMSYVFSGAYSPLMCKIIEQVMVMIVVVVMMIMITMTMTAMMVSTDPGSRRCPRSGGSFPIVECVDEVFQGE